MKGTEFGWHVMKDFLTCEMLAYYNWKDIGPQEPQPHFIRGEAVHQALHSFRHPDDVRWAGLTPAEVFWKVVQEEDPHWEESEAHYKDWLEIVHKYIEEKSEVPWEFVAPPETEGRLQLPNGLEMTYRLDELVEQDEWFYPLDYKTTGWSGGGLLRSLELDGQISTYVAGVQQATDKRIGGMWIEAFFRKDGCKINPDIFYNRELFVRSDQQLNTFVKDMGLLMERYLGLREKPQSGWIRSWNCFRFFKMCPYAVMCQHPDRDMQIAEARGWLPEEKE